MQKPFRTSWKKEHIDTLLYLFHLLEDNPESFLNAEFMEPVTRNDILNMMNWVRKRYDIHQAKEAIEEKWSV